LVCAEDNILGGCVHTIKENVKALVAASKIGLEVNTDKLSTGSSLDKNAGKITIKRLGNNSFERVSSSILGNNLKELKFYSGRN